MTLTQSDKYLVRVPLETKKRFRMQDRCRVPCGKGSRNCSGQALTTAELYSTIGNIFWRVDILVVEEGVTREDLGLVELFKGNHLKR